LRITYFTDTPRIGGAERFLADVVAGAHRAGHEITVVSPQRALLDFVGGSVHGIGLVEAGRTDFKNSGSRASTIGALSRGVPELRRVLRNTRADLIHVNNGGYPGSDLCRLAVLVAPLARIRRRLLSVNSTPLGRDTSQPQLQAAVDWMVWRAVDRVHATSEFVERGLRQTRGMPAATGVHIPYGVVEPAASAEPVLKLRRMLAPRHSDLLVGMVSATSELEKGHHILLEALAELDDDVRAVIVGPNAGALFLDHIAGLALEERVTVVGRLSSNQVGTYLSAIDVLVVPSTAYESLPLVILEAMASGKAVFGSRLSGIPEAIADGETGRLFTPGSVEELAGLLRTARSDPEAIASMGKRGKERWRERFSPEVMLRSILSLYDEL
jgi:glycosyltransferase involved in cell wall biosynthesis